MQSRSSSILMRLGLAFCFLGFGIWEIVSPSLWTTYLPEFLSSWHPIFWIEAHGITLSLTAIGILSGLYQKFFSLLGVLIMAEICIEIFVQEGFTDIFIRDIAILLFSGALMAAAWQPSEK